MGTTAMSEIFNVACIQNCAGDNLAQNLADIVELIHAAHREGAQLICLPENFAYLGQSDRDKLASALGEAGHPVIDRLCNLAVELRSWILMGSLAIKIAPEKTHNRSYLIDRAGNIVACYNKLHLFDVNLKEGENYRESAVVQAGDSAVLAGTPWGMMGLSICYDLRFAYLYRALAQAGADFLAIPSAFSETTGTAHWHILQRARAIETGCYVFAPDQCGMHPGGRKTYGHSLIVDPWGTILADGGNDAGVIIAAVGPDKVRAARHNIPALKHDQTFSGPEGSEKMRNRS